MVLHQADYESQNSYHIYKVIRNIYNKTHTRNYKENYKSLLTGSKNSCKAEIYHDHEWERLKFVEMQDSADYNPRILLNP